MKNKKAKILVVDDEENICRVMSVILSRNNYEVETASSGEMALLILKEKPFDLVICDIRMPDIDGLSILREIKKQGIDTLVILMTAFGTVETAVEAIKEGAVDYFSKPINTNEMLLRVERALEERKMKETLTYLKKEVKRRFGFENIVGNCPKMREIFTMIERVAQYKSSVLITGESGTGKELIARAIHYNGPRANNKFVAINCGALPAELFESELFGHIKGSFSGAIANKKGLFEEADGGTLFLDEVAEIPAVSQVKLLRALQEEEIRPVGSNENIKVDVRIISATEKDLSEEVARGKFRESLYYRLNVVPIHIPPLRARKEDIPLLVDHFIEKFCQENKRPKLTLSKKAFELVMDYSWPGNVRELENAIERAVIMTDGNEIKVEDLMSAVQKKPSDLSVSIPPNVLNMKEVLQQVTEMVEREMIQRALKQSGSNRKLAAEMLGISQRSLMYKIKEYNLG